MRVDVRLDDDVWMRAERFMREHGLEGPSACLKVLVEIGLARVEAIEPAVRAAAIREGIRQGKKTVKEKLEKIDVERARE